VAKQRKPFLLFRPPEEAQLRFYGAYDPEFLYRKVDILHAIYKNRDEFGRFMTAIGGTNDGQDENHYFTALAIEIYCSTFQQFESLFALLMAVFQTLPHWLFLTRYTTDEMLRKIEAFARGEIADLTGGSCCSGREFIAKAVYPGTEIHDNTAFAKTLDDLSWFLTEMAKSYLAGRSEYNAYKHGLRVLAGDGVQLRVDVGRGSGDYRPVFTMGHSISFLEIEKRTNEYAAEEITKEINEEGSFQAMHIMCAVAKATRKIRLAVLRREKCVEIPTFEIDRVGLLKLKPVTRFAFPF
jgi:hypothetical protein